MRHLPRSLVLVVALASLARAADALFTFAPPAGLECAERRRQTVVKDAGKAGGTTEDVTDSTVRLRFARTRDGVRMTSTVTDAEVTRNGTRVVEPVTAALIDRDVEYDIGADGTLRAVRGFDAVAEAATKAARPDMRTALHAMLDPAAFERREQAEWTRRMGALVGKRVAEGDVWEERTEVPGPAGPVSVIAVTRFTRLEERDGRTAVTVDYAYGADAPAARRRLGGGAQPDDTAHARTPAGEERAVVAEGDGTRVIEAGTMTVLWERLTQVTVAPADVPGIGRVVVRRTDRRESAYRCTVPAAAG